MALLNRSSSRVPGSQQLWSGGAGNSQPQEALQASSHLRASSPAQNGLNAKGAEGQRGKWEERS